MGNEEFWDNKFAGRSDNPLSAEKSLVENFTCFKKGTVLDIACGDGRNALFLLEKGFNVTGVDFSGKALERLKMFAQRNNYLVDTEQIDLSSSLSLKSIGIFDNIVINHYRLSKAQLEELKDHIAEGGILFISGFGYKHKVDSKIRKDDLMQPSDFEDMKNSFELISYTEDEDNRGFLVTYIFRKNN